MPRRPPALVTPLPRPRASSAARGYGPAWRKLRRLVAATRPAVCVRCGRADISRRMHLDHIKPLAQGGSNDPANLQWLCHACHNKKTREEG